MRPIIPLLTALAVAALAPPVQAGLLTGQVEYDPAAGLFTYAYALDNTAGPWAVTEVSILVAPNRAAYDLLVISVYLEDVFSFEKEDTQVLWTGIRIPSWGLSASWRSSIRGSGSSRRSSRRCRTGG